VVSPVTTNDELISELWIKTEQEKILWTKRESWVPSAWAIPGVKVRWGGRQLSAFE
jgi:ADP-ribose pyrophosphatase YjhB (NUDIX family)